MELHNKGIQMNFTTLKWPRLP